jgi:hypothetical protein
MISAVLKRWELGCDFSLKTLLAVTHNKGKIFFFLDCCRPRIRNREKRAREQRRESYFSVQNLLEIGTEKR